MQVEAACLGIAPAGALHHRPVNRRLRHHRPLLSELLPLETSGIKDDVILLNKSSVARRLSVLRGKELALRRQA